MSLAGIKLDQIEDANIILAAIKLLLENGVSNKNDSVLVNLIDRIDKLENEKLDKNDMSDYEITKEQVDEIFSNAGDTIVPSVSAEELIEMKRQIEELQIKIDAATADMSNHMLSKNDIDEIYNLYEEI